MGETVKVRKGLIQSITNAFKTEMFRASTGQFIFKMITLPLPTTTITAGRRAFNSIWIDQDSHFKCDSIYVFYDWQPDLLLTPAEFIDIQIFNPSDEDLIMREPIDVRAIGFPWFHANVPPKDLYYHRRGVPFPHLFLASTKINIQANYYHSSEVTQNVVVVFKGGIIKRQSILTGDIKNAI